MIIPGSEPRDEAEQTPDQPRSKWLAWIPQTAAAATLALTAGIAGATIASPDHLSDTSPEAGFSRDMAIHHAQAVDMANTVRDNTSSREIRTLALDIVLTQQNQIGRMQGWLIQWNLPMTGDRPAMSWMNGQQGHQPSHPATSSRPGAPMPGMATTAELQRLRLARGKAAEVLFLTLMIRHHRGGIQMADAALQHTSRDEVRDLARSIVSGQQAEINAMQQLLRDRDARPA